MSTRRFIFALDEERDADILGWLAHQPSKSVAIRAALRVAAGYEPPLSAALLRQVVRDELKRAVVAVGPRETAVANADALAAQRLDSMF